MSRHHESVETCHREIRDVMSVGNLNSSIAPFSSSPPFTPTHSTIKQRVFRRCAAVAALAKQRHQQQQQQLLLQPQPQPMQQQQQREPLASSEEENTALIKLSSDLQDLNLATDNMQLLLDEYEMRLAALAAPGTALRHALAAVSSATRTATSSSSTNSGAATPQQQQQHQLEQKLLSSLRMVEAAAVAAEQAQRAELGAAQYNRLQTMFADVM